MFSRIKTSTAAALITAVLTGAGPSSAAPVCFHNYDIENTSVRDARTIDFRMKDGQVWRNHLKTSCPGLLFNGFVYKLSGTDEICDNLFSIRVLKTGEVCLLGDFTKA